ncbi:helix-turn-helix domain-containing protein [Streptomyces varsoviensis]|uniref:helix-turn-helix domain-containing protein n=1 Tax=Streptomyces varsoviensis TaxID=67373 RepID=UPI00066242C9|nr:helix-turn-helix transcriptional regulator [Streptomyces varsoviensis]
MVRTPLTELERERGRHLGVLLRQARGERSMAEIAALAGISAETLRKIETGRAPTPAFFTITALASALGLRLDELALQCAERCAAAMAAEPPELPDLAAVAGAVGEPVAA